MIQKLKLEKWSFISPDEAYNDPIAAQEPRASTKLNDGRVLALAKEKGYGGPFSPKWSQPNEIENELERQNVWSSAPPAAIGVDCSNIISKEDSAFADRYFDWLSGTDFDKAGEMIEPKMRLQMVSLKDGFQKAFSAVKPFEKKMIGCFVNYFKSSDVSTRSVNLSYEWSSTDKWYTGNLAWRESGNSKEVYGLHIDPLRAPLEKLHAFTFKNKGVLHWSFLIVSVLNPLLILWALVVCIKTKPLKRKWLWILFIIVGFIQTNLNWTTGAIKINPLSFTIFGSGFSHPTEYSPWIFMISVPIGAIVFLLQRRKLATETLSGQS
jgi:hypothetical protein